MGNECTLKMHKEHANSQSTKESNLLLDSIGDHENVGILEILHIMINYGCFQIKNKHRISKILEISTR